MNFNDTGSLWVSNLRLIMTSETKVWDYEILETTFEEVIVSIYQT